MDNLPEHARHFPATARNREPIRDVLARVLPAAGTVLEIASGTGEHILYLAGEFPDLTWQPSDADPLMIASIEAWSASAPRPNLAAPLLINASDVRWPVDGLAAVMCINMLHISPWDAAEGLMRNGAAALAPGGLLYLYGPYRVGGRHTAPSNATFDMQLRRQNDTWGLRDLEAVVGEAEKNGLSLAETVAMPANNLSVILRKPA